MSTDQNKSPPHTPLPWVIEPRQWDHGASIAIVSPTNGYIVAIIPYDEDIQEVDQPDFKTVKRHSDEIPNAEFIAHACSIHYELIAALELAHDHLALTHYDLDGIPSPTIKQIVSAITKAKGAA